jgi:hypothetical protein
MQEAEPGQDADLLVVLGAGADDRIPGADDLVSAGNVAVQGQCSQCGELAAPF